jgi:hypothetical protein
LAVVSKRWVVATGGSVTAVLGASQLGVLATVAVVLIVALMVGPDWLDAGTRRFQAATDRMVQLHECPACTKHKKRWWRRAKPDG